MAEEKEEKVEVPEKFKALVEKIEQMSVLDLAELVKILEKKFGVSAQAPVMAMAPPPPRTRGGELGSGFERKRQKGRGGRHKKETGSRGSESRTEIIEVRSERKYIETHGFTAMALTRLFKISR